MKRRATLLLGLVFLAILLIPGIALARLGGGESFGGGGGGGGSSDDGGCLIELIFYLIQLCFECPQVGLPLTAIVIVGAFFYYNSRPATPTVTPRISISSGGAPIAGPTLGQRVLPIDQLKAQDPFFSTPLFLDFVQLLFARFHVQRGKRRLAPLSPYVAKVILDRPAMRQEIDSVEDVLIASSRIRNVVVGDPVRVTVSFTANYRETAQGKTTQFYTDESWTFSRDRGVRSKPPEEIARLGCPACGSAEEPRDDGSCPHCGQMVQSGAFHWFVTNIATFEKRPAVVFTPSDGEEAGTDLPTVFSPTLAEQQRAFRARHPEFSAEAFAALVKDAFLKLQEAWSEQKWERARALETDHLFQVHRYWIEQYQRAGLVNRLDRVEIEKVLPCKIETDAFYEAITVRIFASGHDYTVDRTGKVVAGSRTQSRRFSEYWTFLRRIGCEKQATPITGGCPSCGAELKVSMAGVCEYCHSKVTSGQFGWVLTSIDQSSEYRG